MTEDFHELVMPLSLKARRRTVLSIHTSSSTPSRHSRTIRLSSSRKRRTWFRLESCLGICFSLPTAISLVKSYLVHES